MNNYTELIDQYLDNTLSAEERTSFENELKTNEYLRKEFELQKNIMEGLKRAGIKHEFSQAIRHHLLMKGIAKIASIVVATAALSIMVYFILSPKVDQGKTAQDEIRTELLTLEKFGISTERDTVIETKGGIVFAIPAKAFKTESKSIEIDIQEALNPLDIMKAGLSTTSNGELLQTAGMFYINASENGKELELVKNIQASIPADSINPKMMLFDGKIDKDGNINWVNPVKIEKDLRTYDIQTLDFYPADYLPTLKALDLNYKNKRYTDSLYYSFSGFRRADQTQENAYRPVDQKNILIISDNKGVMTAIYDNKVRKFFSEKSWKSFIDSVPVRVYVDRRSQTVRTSDSITTNMYYEIDPSKIKAIWNSKFNNTILATKEFEERLKFIHTTCTPEILEEYIRHIGTSLYIIDSICASRTNGDFKKKFLEFYKRKDGGVKVSDRMQEKLSRYFSEKYEVYKKAAEKTWEKYEDELKALNEIADVKRREQATDDFTRESKVFNEEYCLNLVDAYRQIGEKKECPQRTPPPAKNYYNVNIVNTGWKNLDQYVFEATLKRESLDYVTEDGRKASITYSGITVNVEGMDQYDRVLAYLIPDSLSSFQRMQQKGNAFTEKLNSLLHYDLVVLAYKGSQAYYAKKEGVQATTYTFTLSPVTENEMKKILQPYAKDKRKDMTTEIAYQAFEQKEVIRQVKLQKDLNRRNQIAKSIFPCFEYIEQLSSVKE